MPNLNDAGYWSSHDQVEAADEINQLRKDLSDARQIIDEENKDHIRKMAEREAEIVKLIGVITLCSTNDGWDGIPTRKRPEVIEALYTPPSTSHLEQWERDRYGEPTSFYECQGCGEIRMSRVTSCDCCSDLPIDELQLYARKDK